MGNPYFRVRASGKGGSGYVIPALGPPGQMPSREVKNADGDSVRARVDHNGDVIRLIGVTTATKYVGDPSGLIQFAVDQTAAHAVANIDGLLRRTEDQGWGFLRYFHRRKPDLTDPLRSAHSGVLNDLAELGTNVHDWVEYDLTHEGFPPDVDSVEMSQMIDAWEDFKFMHEIEVVEVEVTVFNLEYGYAGTFDILAYVDGVLTLIDLKTSRKVHASHLMQMAALKQAFFADGAFHETPFDGWQKYDLPEPEKYAIIQLRPDDDEGQRRAHMEEIPDDILQIYWRRFQAALTVCQCDWELKQIEKSAKLENKEED